LSSPDKDKARISEMYLLFPMKSNEIDVTLMIFPRKIEKPGREKKIKKKILRSLAKKRYYRV
jgi:hypothetical protein